MKHRKDFPRLLNIGAISTEKMFGPVQTDNRTLNVLDAPLIAALKEVLGFEYKILQPLDGPFGKSMPDGNYSGIVGMVHRGEVDIAMGKLSINEDRSHAVDFSYPYEYAPITFVTDNPEFLPNTYAVVYPFALSVWIAVAISLLVMVLVSCAFKNKKHSAHSLALNIFGSLLEKSINLEYPRLSTTLLIIFWIIGSLFLTNGYKAVLLSFLTFPTAVGIRDVSQLAEASGSSFFKCSTYPGSFIYSTLLEGDSDNWKKIGNCLTRSDAFTADIEEFLKPSTHKKAFLGAKVQVGAFYKNYLVSDESIFVAMVAVAVRKKFCCKEALDRAIHNLAAMGLLHKFIRDQEFFNSLLKSYQETEQLDPNRKLALEDMGGAFIFLISGCVLAAIVFLLELFVGRSQRTLKRRRNIR